jgi:hypothetical protein
MMFGRRRKVAARRAEPSAAMIESLECRTLLSAVTAATTSTVQGFSPSQIRQAYGFNQVTFGAGVTADGTGQTIAIIDAYNDPNIKSDLNVFDTQFGLGSANLKIVNQTGGSTLPTTDSGWAGEISLDVEWAHAIAPGASILLVEATSSDLTDLMAGVNYARNAPGVSTVSMSWGGSEFFSFNGGEFSSQTNYDPYFTTPAGHQGVTFIAAAGDSGTFSGVQWPASSPNVISVGGTSLYTSDSSGTYSSESSWSGTSGGFSQVESEPNYQLNVQSTGVRTSPDVAYNADPNTGFAVYDSVPSQGISGWQVVGGTSAGAPQWAALIAIADQGRVLAGNSTLDGASQTLPLLYSFYGQPGTSGYSSYTTDFNDVIDTSAGGRVHWRWGGYGFAGTPATAGYDTITGLGTPRTALIQALASASPATLATIGSTSGTGGTLTNPTNPVPSSLPPSPLVTSIVNNPPVSVIGGKIGTILLDVTNSGATRFHGPVTITLDASTDTSLSSDDTSITTITLANLTLASGASKTLRLHFSYPTGLADQQYYVIASTTAVGTGTAAAETITATPVEIVPATVDFAVSFPASQPILVTPGQNSSVLVTVKNVGNSTAIGMLGLNLYASVSGLLDSAAQLLVAIPSRKVTVHANGTVTFRVHFVAPAGKVGGNYSLLASAVSSTIPADGNSSNNIAVIGTRSA